jgi:signal transduction histidine kinase
MKSKFVFSGILSIAIWFFGVIPSNCFTETARIDSLLKELKNSKQEERFEILHDLGWAYKDIDTEKAMEFEQTALDLAINWGDSIRVARSLYHLARINTHRNYDLAVKYSERSIGLIIYNKDAKDIAKYYRNLVFIHENNYQYEAALNTYERAYAYLADHDEIISTNILKSITEILISMGDYEAAQEICEKRLQIWEKYGDDYKIADSYLDLGRINWFLGLYTESGENYNKSYEIIKQMEINERSNEHNLNVINFNLSLLNLTTGNFESAIRNINKCLNYSKKIGDLNQEIELYELLRVMYYNMGNNEKSFYYGLKMIKITKIIGDYSRLGKNIINIGELLCQKEKLTLAKECVEIAKSISGYVNDKRSMSFFYDNLGLLYYSLGEYEKTDQFYQKTLLLKKEVNDKRGFAECLKNIAELYIATSKENEAYNLLYQSLELSEGMGAIDIKRDVLILFSKYFELQNLFKESLEYLQRFEIVRESLTSNEKLAAINLMDIELTSLEKQKELDLLERENSIISRELEKEKLIRVILIMLTSALLLFAVSLILYSRSIKRSNQKLADEINTRTQSEAVLQELKQELEQRVKDRTSDLMDINEQLKDTVIRNKRSEKILMEAEKMAGIGELAAGIAHEIRNPIAIIKSTAQYLKENYSETEKIMKNLIYNSDEINQVIFKLMEFAKLDSPNPEEVKISTFLKICLEKFEYEIVQRQIELRIEELQQDITVKIDAKLYEILLTNLISNALEGILDKGIITLALTKEQTCLLLEITDNGTGIENPEKALIPFFTTKKHHSGLGLCFVKHIAALHNTKFELESDLGRGTKVKLSIILN